MFRLRAAKSYVWRRIAAYFGESQDGVDALALRMAKVTSAVHIRETAGHVTTLRQMHKICDLEQPEALSVVAELERAGILVIERNLGDAFESAVMLSEDAKRRLAKDSDRKAA